MSESSCFFPPCQLPPGCAGSPQPFLGASLRAPATRGIRSRAGQILPQPVKTLPVFISLRIDLRRDLFSQFSSPFPPSLPAPRSHQPPPPLATPVLFFHPDPSSPLILVTTWSPQRRSLIALTGHATRLRQCPLPTRFLFLLLTPDSTSLPRTEALGRRDLSVFQ